MGFLRRIIYFVTGGRKSKPRGMFVDTDTSNIARTMPISLSPAQHYIIRRDGEYHIYDSLNEMDAPTRAEFEKLESNAPFNVFVEGERKTYSSYEKIPEEIRNALKKFDKSGK